MVGEFSRLRLYSLAALVVLPFSSVCLSYAWAIACGGWPCSFSMRPSSLHVAVDPFWCGEAVSSFSPPPLRGVGVCWASYWCLLLCLCGFPRSILPQVTLRGLRTLSGSRCLSCSCGGAMSVGFAVSALLLRWWRRLGCRPSLVVSVLLVHRLACRCSLGSAPCDMVLPRWLCLLFVWQCGGALWLPEPLGLCWLFCHPLLRFSASLGAVLCSLFGFPCLRVPALLACGAS